MNRQQDKEENMPVWEYENQTSTMDIIEITPENGMLWGNINFLL